MQQTCVVHRGCITKSNPNIVVVNTILTVTKYFAYMVSDRPVRHVVCKCDRFRSSKLTCCICCAGSGQPTRSAAYLLRRYARMRPFTSADRDIDAREARNHLRSAPLKLVANFFSLLIWVLSLSVHML